MTSLNGTRSRPLSSLPSEARCESSRSPKASAAYRASADLLIDQDEFVRDALGFHDEDESTGAEPTAALAHKPNDRDLASAALILLKKTIDNATASITRSSAGSIRVCKMPVERISDWSTSVCQGICSTVSSWEKASTVVGAAPSFRKPY
jgi:hypothetical protein